MSKQSSPASGATRNGGCLQAFNRIVNGTLERVFDALGRFIGRRPILVIILSVVVTLILGSGVIRIKNETRGEKLWVPDDNESQRRNDFVNDNFPSTARLELFQVRRADGGNILTPEALDKFVSIHNTIIGNLSYPNPGYEGLPDTISFSTLCLNKDSSEGAQDVVNDCIINNPAEIFGYNASQWATSEAILATLNNEQLWDPDLTGQGFTLDQVLGGLLEEGGQVQSAQVLAGYYFLAGNETLRQEQKTDDPANDWEEQFLDFLEAQDLEDSEYVITRFATRSFEDEFGGTIAGDLAMLQIAIVCIIIFTSFALSNCKDGFVGRRVALTWCGIINVGLAVLSSYGLASYIGLLFTPLMSILPFIMLGIGVDGMFVLTTALDGTDEQLPLDVRMGQAMREGGVSVLIASLTNFGAFMIGSNTSLPALSAFSIYAALGLLFNLLLQITFFAACMALDKKRQVARRADICCCRTCGEETKDMGVCSGFILPGFPKQRISVVIMSWLGRQYSKMPVKVAVLLLYAAVLAAGIYGTSQMRVDADVNDFIPQGSYLRDWVAVQQDYFGAAGTAVKIYWTNSEPEFPVDFTTAEVQQQMDRSLELYSTNEYVTPGTLSSWWVGFKEFKNGTVDAATFYQDLEVYLSGPGLRFSGDVVFKEVDVPSSGIFAARSEVTWRYIEDTNDQIKAMDSMRDVVDEIQPPLGPNTFPFDTAFLDIEQYKTIGKEALMNIGLGFAMIAVVVLLLVANPITAVLTFVNVASAILALVGFMNFQGTYIDSVSVIFLVISLGLAVDYSVHVANGYLATRIDDHAERLASTMANTGAAVINGAISTLIAALCLSGSGSYVFVTFFYALLFIVLCGAFQGLVVLPVMLDILKPPYNVSVTHSKESSAGNTADGPQFV